MPARIYHWKHGWIPLTHTAALSKAKGSEKGARRELAKSVAAGHAHPSALKDGAATQGTHVRGLKPVSIEHLPRSNRIIAAHDAKGRGFSLLQGDATVHIPEALGDHFHDRGHKIIRLLPKGGKDGGDAVVVETSEGGVKVFRADGSDRNIVDPAKTPPVDQGDKAPAPPARPEWAKKVAEVAARLPKDRDNIGYRIETQDVETMRREAIESANAHYGGPLEELDAKIAGAQANLKNWRALIDAADNHPGIYSAKTWPPELADLAKEAGFGRRFPRLVLPPLLRAIRDQDTALMRLQGNRTLLKKNLDHWAQHDFKPTVTRVQDLTPEGELGAEVAAALKTVKDVGRMLDDQVERRVAARLAGRPHPGAQLKKIQDRIDVILEERNRLHTAGDDAGYDATTPELQRWRDAREELWAGIKRYREDRQKVYAEELTKTLSELRPMGGPGLDYVKGLPGHGAPKGGQTVLPSDIGDLAGRMRDAEKFYPTRWLEHARRANPKVELILTNRGYNSQGRLIALSGPKDDVSTAVHELGHSMELAVPGLSGLEWAYHYERSSSVKDGRRQLEAPEELWAHPGEYTHKDKWANPYTGKKYANNGKHGQYEIFTTGVESLFSKNDYFDKLEMVVDVEFRQFMLGVLSAL